MGAALIYLSNKFYELGLNMRTIMLPVFPTLLFNIACVESPKGLLLTPTGDGPKVIIDWDAKPLPELHQ